MAHSANRTSTVLAILLLFSLVAAACGGSDDSAAEAAVEAVETSAPEPTAAPAPTEAPAPTAVPEPTAEPTAIPEPTAEPEGDAFSAITDEVQAFVDEKGLEGAGLIIVHGDEGVLYHEHFGDFTEDRISLIASSSKMIAAGVLLKLQEDGMLDINAPVESIADWATGNPGITTAQLISNSSGLVGLGPDFLYAPYLCQWGVPYGLQECGELVFSGEGDDADVVPPDSEFRYGGAQWQVAGGVAEAVSGKSWDELINEIYVEPCGVDSLGFISLGAVLTGAPGYPTVFAGDPDSVTESANPSIEGGAHITSGDYGKLLLMHLRGGQCGDNQVLSQESLDTMHADRIAAAYDGDAYGEDTGYGMGWWVDRDTGRISDGGAWGALPWLDLDDNYGAYIIVEDDSSTGSELKDRIEDLVHDAVTANA